MAAELSEHPKERAEHVMLVDLARNDVGRVVTFGTERMEELMVLERYSHVMHLTSQVAGELREGANAVDVLRATFPAGTVSGAPKVRAMEIIDALEPTKRGAYAGVVGYLDFSGNLDTAIAIRTMIWRDGHASVQAGAGIVADSVAADEDLECHNKARALLTDRGRGPLAHVARRRRAVVVTDPGTADGLAADLSALREGDAWVDRSDRGFVTVAGPDTFSFLQALVSADLDPLADGDAVHSLLLAPQGKLDVDFRLLRVGPEEAWLDCAPGLGAQLTASLTRFRIRVKAEIVDRTGELGMLSRIGAADGVDSGVDSGVDGAAEVPEGVHRIDTAWGFDLVGPRSQVEDAARSRHHRRPGRVRGLAHRAGHPGATRRRRRHHHPAGGVPRAGRGVVHQGLLHRPGAGVPHRQPRPRQPLPPPRRRHRGRLAAGRRRDRRRRQGRRRAHQRGAGGAADRCARLRPPRGGAAVGGRAALGRRLRARAVVALDRARSGTSPRSACPTESIGSTWASPPIASASSCTMARPMPVPSVRPGTVRDV